MRSNQPIQIVRFELVRVGGERFQITNPIGTGSGSEVVMERQCRERGEAASAAARDDRSVAINETLVGKVAGAIDAIGDVNDAPALLQPITVGPSVAAAASVVNIEHGYTTARPVLNAELQGGRGLSGRPTMAHYHQRRLLILRTHIVSISRGIEQAVGDLSIGRLEG